jgi:hypothetical protein
MPLTHLKPVPGDQDVLRYRDREEGDLVEVEVYYSRGMTSASRGIFLAIRPAHIDGAGIYSCVLMQGRSTRVRVLARSSPRVLAEVAAGVDAKVAELAAAYRADRAAGSAAFDALAAAVRAG